MCVVGRVKIHSRGLESAPPDARRRELVLRKRRRTASKSYERQGTRAEFYFLSFVRTKMLVNRRTAAVIVGEEER